MLRNFGYRSVLISITLLSISISLLAADLPAGGWSGIDYIPSAMGDIAEQERQTSIYYHTNSLDQLWYGTDIWAVKFDIGHIVNVDSFRVESVNIYFPQGVGSFDLRIYTDILQPLDSLAVSYSDITVNQGWNNLDLPLNDQVTGDNFWIVVEYETNSFNRHMGASATGGENSYYWVPPQGPIQGYFANMAETNIVAELLIGVAGTMYFPGFDLELTEFWFAGNFNTGGNIYPNVTIRNNAGMQVEELVGIAIRLDNADPQEGAWLVTIPYDLDLMPGEEITVSFDLPPYNYRLLGSPAQYRARAELQHDDDLYMVNNIITYSFDNYTLLRERFLIENFVRSGHQPSLNMINAQQGFAADSLYFINNFFHPQDIPYYTQGATIRRDFYALGGYPFTIIEGKESIAGYPANYTDLLSAKLNGLSPKKTFLQFDEASTQKAVDPDDLIMELRFTISNNNSFVFTDNLSNLRMFMALVEKNTPDIEGKHLVHLHRYQSTGALQLGHGNEHVFHWLHSLLSVETIHWDLIPANFSNFEIIYWLQDNQKREIYFAGSFRLEDFDLVTSLEDGIVQTPTLPAMRIYPNPAQREGEINIGLTDLSRGMVQSEIGIYNIRGQLVKRFGRDAADPAGNIVWNGIGDNGQRIASGIYLARFSYTTESGQKRSVTEKFLILPR